MPTVTVRIPNGGGSVRVSQKKSPNTYYEDMGIATPSAANSFEIAFWDYGEFVGVSDKGYVFEKFCLYDPVRYDQVTCTTNPTLFTQIEKMVVLDAYFVPVPPPPPPPQNPIVDWIWKNLLWWLK